MSNDPRLTESQKHELCSILLLGCDRTTARNYLGLSTSSLSGELDGDAAFARRVLRAEATAELHHMRNVHHAAKDEKNWRTSVWWLERRAPERFGRRDGQAMTPTQFENAIDEAAKVIIQEISGPEERRKLLEQLRRVVADAVASDGVAGFTSSYQDADSFEFTQEGSAADMDDRDTPAEFVD